MSRIAQLSDEEIMGMSSPADAGIAPPTEEEKAAAAAEAEAAAGAGAGSTGDTSGSSEVVEGGATGDEDTGSTGDAENAGAETKTGEDDQASGGADSGADGVTTGSETADTTAVGDGNQAPAGDKPAGDAAKDGKPAAVSGEAAADGQTSEPDYKAFYTQAMSFKANGRTVELKSPDEAIKLMQMGANYTRRMQELAPHRKVLTMLQNHKVDEAKLDFLIALDKGDPEAVKKLLVDRQIDPLEIDTAKAPDFRGGENAVSDDEVAFRTQLDDLQQSPEGQATIAEMNRRLDDSSKEILWSNPEIMATLHEQRAAGVYDLVVAEMDRLITLGEIKPNTPFLQAYKTAGDKLVAAASGNQGGTTSGQAGQPAPTVVATRTAAPKSSVANGDKAAAASSSRSTPAGKQPLTNPLAMSDDEFLKKLEGRV
jgi:hypothetical protein